MLLAALTALLRVGNFMAPCHLPPASHLYIRKADHSRIGSAISEATSTCEDITSNLTFSQNSRPLKLRTTRSPKVNNMGNPSSKPVTQNSQALVISKGAMSTINLHDDTLYYVLVFGGIIMAAIGGWYFWTRYKRQRKEARPIRAANRLHRMEMEQMLPSRQMNLVPPLHPLNPFYKGGASTTTTSTTLPPQQPPVSSATIEMPAD